MIVKILICDLCDAEGLPDCGRNTMREHGWTVAKNKGADLDLCPRCSAK